MSSYFSNFQLSTRIDQSKVFLAEVILKVFMELIIYIGSPSFLQGNTHKCWPVIQISLKEFLY